MADAAEGATGPGGWLVNLVDWLSDAPPLPQADEKKRFSYGHVAQHGRLPSRRQLKGPSEQKTKTEVSEEWQWVKLTPEQEAANRAAKEHNVRERKKLSDHLAEQKARRAAWEKKNG